MPVIDMRRLPPGRVVTLANSGTLGPVLSIARLARHRHEAGAQICGFDPESKLPLLSTVDMIKYLTWLLTRRHAPKPAPAAEPGAPKPGSLAAFVQRQEADIAAMLKGIVKP